MVCAFRCKSAPATQRTCEPPVCAVTTIGALQKLRMEEVQGSRLGVTREDVVACFQTVALMRQRSKLPADATWFVLDPTSLTLFAWDWLMRILSLYMFCEVPFNIAFRASIRLGAHHTQVQCSCALTAARFPDSAPHTAAGSW